MTIKIECPGCKSHFKVSEQFAGRRGRCPTCKKVIQIPALAQGSPSAAPRDAATRPPKRSAPVAADRRAAATQPPAVPSAAPPLEAAKPAPSPPPPPTAAASGPPAAPPAVPAKPTPQRLAGTLSPYVAVPAIRDPQLQDVPQLESFQQLRHDERIIKTYRIRVHRPKFPWPALGVSVLLWLLIPVIPTLIVLAIHFLKQRGHTFLYLTNRRLIIVELDESIFGRSQTMMNYDIESISGFSLMTQRGVQKLLNLILLNEKRTFYISILTSTLATFELGSASTRNSDYDPGGDAVSLCGELDALVLAIKAGRA